MRGIGYRASFSVSVGLPNDAPTLTGQYTAEKNFVFLTPKFMLSCNELRGFAPIGVMEYRSDGLEAAGVRHKA